MGKYPPVYVEVITTSFVIAIHLWKNLNDWAAIFPLKTWDNRENKQRESTNEDGSTMDNDEEF